MLRSMYSGIGGMKNFQIKLDVIGNNIANVNTYGYKKVEQLLKDLVSQQISGASAATSVPPAPGTGGVNTKQVGLGSQLGSIDNIHTQGSLQTTGRPLDLGISGDGYFMVTDGVTEYFTRAGNFYLDVNGNVVNSDGLYLADSTGAHPINVPLTSESFSIAKDGTVNTIPAATTPVKVGLSKFANPEGLEKAGDNLYVASPNAGTPVPGAPGQAGTGLGTLVSGALEMSNVDLSEEFTDMIVAQRGFQANTRIITTSDEILQELVNLKR